MRMNLEEKELMVILEYQNPIGMPVRIKKRMSEREFKEWKCREDIRIVSVAGKC